MVGTYHHWCLLERADERNEECKLRGGRETGLWLTFHRKCRALQFACPPFAKMLSMFDSRSLS